jgi:hypothetical protein
LSSDFSEDVSLLFFFEQRFPMMMMTALMIKREMKALNVTFPQTPFIF